MDREFLEKCLAEGMSLREIGELVGRERSTISYHLKKHGMTPVNQGKAANKGGICEEVLEIMVADRLPLAEMARQLDRSVATTRYWLRKYGFWPLPAGLRRKAARAARQQGRTRVELECSRHGPTEFILEGSGRYRCLKCRREGVIRWRRNAKRRLVAEVGGRCSLCGYDKCHAALEFHHLNPAQKSFGLSMRGITRSIDKLREEAAKCVLLCANCHAEVECGATQLPQNSLDGEGHAVAKLNGTVVEASRFG